MIAEGDYVTDPMSQEQLIKLHRPRIAKACPKRLKLESGKSYLYCTCGHSQNQPFCDGAHRALQDYKDDEGNTYKPLKIDLKVAATQRVWCMCKRNMIKAGPNCDGMHSRIDDW